MKSEIMIQNKKNLAWPGIMVFALAFTLSACNDDPEVVYVGDMPQYQKAYITTGVSYPNSTVLDNISVSFGEVQQQEDGTLKYESKMDLKGENNEQEIYFRTTYPVKTPLSGTVAPRIDSEEYVEQYNTEHELDGDNGYKLLPTEWYTLEGSPTVIESGQKEAVIRLVMRKDAPWIPGKYLIPLHLTLGEGSSVTLSENMSDLCLFVHPNSDGTYEGGRFLTADDFTVNKLTGSGGGNSTHSSDNTYGNAFDYDPKTLWGKSVSDGRWDKLTVDTSVEIEFKKPCYLSHVYTVNNKGDIYVYAKEEGTSDFKSYNKRSSGGAALFEFNMLRDLKLDPEKKVDKVKIRNMKGFTADVYFLVHD